MRNKTIYFAQRNPSLGERFRPRWRRHGALAMSLPDIWNMSARYTQCDPVDDPPAGLGVTARYDGIGIVWLRDIDAFRKGEASEAMQTMRRDERITFGAPVSEFSFRCSELVLKDDGPALFKIFSVMNRNGDMPADLDRVCAEGLGAELLVDPRLSHRLVRLAVCQRNELSLAQQGIGRTNDALVELSFHTLSEAVAFFRVESYMSITTAHHFVEVERCATRELLLDDRALYD